ncbi:LOW QUALITY PROTEIN: MutT-family protein, partial [Streptomyces sp. e14]
TDAQPKALEANRASPSLKLRSASSIEETGLTVKPESLRVAHIIHEAWGVKAPNGFLTVVFAAHEWTGEPENPASTPRSSGSTPTPSPRRLSVPLQCPPPILE